MNYKKTILINAIAISLCFHVNAAELESDKTRLSKDIKTIENKCDTDGGCTKQDVKELQEKKSTLDSLTETFKFGVAIGFENYKSSYISEVETVGDERVVRIVDSQDQKPSVWLETHYIWDGWASKKGFTHSAPGFYVGARLLGPDSDVFEAFSLGVMWSFKRTAIGNVPPAGQIAESINIGFGPVWHKTKVLASGITEGEPLPSNYNDVKLNNRDEVSWMLMISAGF
jgi:hypothetical protein